MAGYLDAVWLFNQEGGYRRKGEGKVLWHVRLTKTDEIK